MNKEFLQNVPWSFWWVMPESVKRLGGFLFGCLNAIGFTWPFIYGVGPVFYSNIGFSDPLDWRAFSLNSEHHLINLWLVALAFVIMGFYIAGEEEPHAPPLERLRSVYRVGAIAAFAAWLMLAVHEGEWWLTLITFNLYHGFALNWQWFAQGGEIAALATLLLLPIMTGYFPWKFAAFMAVFQVIWFAAGFPITVNYTGNTAGFHIDSVNLWEIDSWGWAVLGFYLTERERFYNMVKTVRSQIKHEQGRNVPSE